MTGNDGKFRRRPSLIAKVFMSQRPQHIDRVDVVQALSDEATQLFGGGPPAFRRRREGKHALGHMRAPTSDGHLTRGDLVERGSERHAEAAAAVEPASATTAGLQAGAIATNKSEGNWVRSSCISIFRCTQTPTRRRPRMDHISIARHLQV
jgi:hypothetical protein